MNQPTSTPNPTPAAPQQPIDADKMRKDLEALLHKAANSGQGAKPSPEKGGKA